MDCGVEILDTPTACSVVSQCVTVAVVWILDLQVIECSPFPGFQYFIMCVCIYTRHLFSKSAILGNFLLWCALVGYMNALIHCTGAARVRVLGGPGSRGGVQRRPSAYCVCGVCFDPHINCGLQN